MNPIEVVVSSILGFLLFIGVSILAVSAIVSVGLWFATKFRRLKQRPPENRYSVEGARRVETQLGGIVPSPTNMLPRMFPQVDRAVPQIPFDQAQLVQPQRNGRMVWQPTPTVDTSASAALDEAWVSTAIEAPSAAKQGRTLVLRVEVSNNHRREALKDQGILEVEYPSSVVQVLGLEPVDLNPQGDTTLIYFQWTVPYLPGNYVLRFVLLNHQTKTEKVLVVK